MKHIQKIKDSQNLLLNLLVRESTNWYFLDINPRYDDLLSKYMDSVLSHGFLRFYLSKSETSLYFPLAYRSLTGMHMFGDRPMLRYTDVGSLSQLTVQEAISKLVEELFPAYNTYGLDKLLEDLEDKYATGVSRALEKLVPEKFIKPLSSQKKKNENNIRSYLPSKDLFNEYGNNYSLSKLLKAINNFAASNGKPTDAASIEWVKKYSILLISKTITNFVSEKRTVSVSLQNTIIVLDESSLPVDIFFREGCPSVKNNQLPTGLDISKLEEHLLSQLLDLHLFPLLRAVGLLGLASEKEILDQITEVFESFHKQLIQELSFFHNMHTKVPLFLSDLMDMVSEYSYQKAHIYNHMLRKAYYSHELMKPKPGEVVHKRYFDACTAEIGIRGFDINTDLEILHKWVNLEYAKKFWEMDGPIQKLEEAYIKHLGVDYSHPYIGTLNGEPTFTLELYWAIKDEVGKYYPFHPGDYGFHMLIAPAKQRIPNFSYYALTMCMEHFFSFKQVHRMIGEASVEHTGTHNLITKVGCEFDKALVLPYKTSNLTFLTREMYHCAVKDVLDSSRTEIRVNI